MKESVKKLVTLLFVGWSASACGLLEDAVANVVGEEEAEADLVDALLGNQPVSLSVPVSMTQSNPVFELPDSFDTSDWAGLFMAERHYIQNGDDSIFDVDMTGFIFTATTPTVLQIAVEIFSQSGQYYQGEDGANVNPYTFNLDSSVSTQADFEAGIEAALAYYAQEFVPFDLGINITATDITPGNQTQEDFEVSGTMTWTSMVQCEAGTDDVDVTGVDPQDFDTVIGLDASCVAGSGWSDNNVLIGAVGYVNDPDGARKMDFLVLQPVAPGVLYTANFGCAEGAGLPDNASDFSSQVTGNFVSVPNLNDANARLEVAAAMVRGGDAQATWFSCGNFPRTGGIKYTFQLTASLLTSSERAELADEE